jgi:hypothetical protein
MNPKFVSTTGREHQQLKKRITRIGTFRYAGDRRLRGLYHCRGGGPESCETPKPQLKPHPSRSYGETNTSVYCVRTYVRLLYHLIAKDARTYNHR